MRILLRCDGGPGIGVGHVVRCMALAEEALARGHWVGLLGRVEGELLGGLVAATGVTLLGPAPEDVDDLVSAMLEASCDLVHIDHYGIGEIHGTLDDACGADPGTDRPVLSSMHDGPNGIRRSDLLIDPTPGSWRAPTGEGELSVAGGRWTPLRRSITTARATRPRTPAQRVLVVMGGTDAAGCTPQVVRALATLADELPLTVTAVSAPATEPALQALARAWPAPGSLEVVPPLADLPAAVRRSDLVVTASGTSLWELCVLGVPTAAVQVVDNQAVGYAVMTQASGVDHPAAVGLGSADDLADVTATTDRLRSALLDATLREHLVDAAHGIVDGQGARRVVELWQGWRRGLESTRGWADGIRARRANLEDTETLWRWRNDPDTRAHSRSSAEVPLETHRAWLEGSLQREDRILLVAEDDVGPIGTVRWDREVAREPQEWEASITVAPERRGQGLAARLLAVGEVALLGERAEGPTVLLAAVHRDNEASRRLFRRSGYLPDSPPDADGFARLVKLAP